MQCGHPNHPFLSPLPLSRPVLPLPLHLLLTSAMQLKWFVEFDDKVALSGGDGGLGVAYNGVDENQLC